MARSSRRLGAKMPGVSTKMICDRALDRDAADQRARGLHLVRDDRDLGADQRVEQRRLAGIGRADQRDEAAARIGPQAFAVGRRVFSHLMFIFLQFDADTASSIAAAAACSAAASSARSPRPARLDRAASTATRRSDHGAAPCAPVRV